MYLILLVIEAKQVLEPFPRLFRSKQTPLPGRKITESSLFRLLRHRNRLLLVLRRLLLNRLQNASPLLLFLVFLFVIRKIQQIPQSPALRWLCGLCGLCFLALLQLAPFPRFYRLFPRLFDLQIALHDLVGQVEGVREHNRLHQRQRLRGSIRRVGSQFLHFAQHGQAADHATPHSPSLRSPSEHGVLAVQVRSGVEGDEELAAVGVRAAVGHAHHALPAVRQARMELVREGPLPEALSARSRAYGSIGGRKPTRRIAALHHEARNQSVERRVVVLPRDAEPEEVLGGARNQVAVDLEVERAEAGHQLHVALLFETADQIVAASLDLLVGGEVVFALHL